MRREILPFNLGLSDKNNFFFVLMSGNENEKEKIISHGPAREKSSWVSQGFPGSRIPATLCDRLKKRNWYQAYFYDMMIIKWQRDEHWAIGLDDLHLETM